MKTPQRNPVIPGNARDRTGTAGILRRAGAAIRRRYAGLLRDVRAIVEAIPTYRTNDSRSAPVLYSMTPEQLRRIAEELDAAIKLWLMSDAGAGEWLFWWDAFEAEAMHLGTAQSSANLTALAPAYAAARPLQAVLYSEAYINRLAAAKFKSYEHWTGTAASVRAELAGLIGQAVVEGKSPVDAARDIAERLGVSRSRALNWAQTDITDALRQARWAESEAAERELGIKTGLLWTSALIPTTRPHHAARNGRVYGVEEVKAFYAQGGNRYNCYLPGTRVAGRFVAGSKARYKGPIVTLVAASGRKLAVTSNHPVMTEYGLVAAAKIKVGDKLIAYSHQIEDAARVADLDGCQIDARIEDVFGALMNFGHDSFFRVGGIDFHGDAAFMDEQIHVVRSDRVLTFALDATGAQFLDDLALVHADAAGARSGPEESFSLAVDAAPGCDVGISSAGLSLIQSSPLISDSHGLADGPVLQSHLPEASTDKVSIQPCSMADGENGLSISVGLVQRGHNSLASIDGVLPVMEPVLVKPHHQGSITNPNAIGDVLERFAGLAAFDEVVDVVFGVFDGHVYDLQEVSGLMISNSITASNCRCAQTEALLDADGNPILTDFLKTAMAKEKAAWQRQHGGNASP